MKWSVELFHLDFQKTEALNNAFGITFIKFEHSFNYYDELPCKEKPESSIILYLTAQLWSPDVVAW